MYFDNIVSNIMDMINDKKDDFHSKYMRDPKYIKIPSWVNELLIQYNKEYVNSFYISHDAPFVGILMNLLVCDTPTIVDIKDIEVF